MLETKSLFSRAWILSDGKMGDLVQCEGLAQSLAIEPEQRIVHPGKFWSLFMPWGPLPPKDRPSCETSPIQSPYPDLVIASGWRTLAYLREIKKRQGDRTFTVFLKNPRIKASYLDLVWVPQHDRQHGVNIISTLVGPHRYSPDLLAREFTQLPDRFAGLPKPLVVVLLGGNSKDFTYTSKDISDLSDNLARMAKEGVGLAITTSRRTPELLKDSVRDALAGMPYDLWDGEGENPYGFLLAHGDRFVVTMDSANMLGEACVTGKPVFYFKPSGGRSPKLERMVQGLTEYGAIRPFHDQSKILEEWSYEPLYAADTVAKEVIKRTASRFSD